MKKLSFAVFVCLLFICINSYALSPQAAEGKKLYSVCHGCHNPDINPPLGPPMWGVQRLYKINTLDNNDFIERMVNFVKAPSLDAAIHKEAVRQLGLMPPLPLGDEVLKQIAAYILEAEFPPPCAHWQNAATRAKARNDIEHAEKDQRMLERFCH